MPDPTPSLDALAAHFETLVALPPEARSAALSALDLSAAERTALEGLLRADAGAETAIQGALAVSALRLEADAPTAAAGSRIGAWEVLRELGAGGMGTVFEVQRVEGGYRQRAALKLLRGFPTEEGRRRIRQERQVLATLEHPWIARLIDGGESSDGQPYFVMDYVDGEDVCAYAARHRLDRGARVALLERIAEAVSHAHQRLVIHRDLKPSNVLVTADGTPRVLDFGVAKLVDVGGDSRDTSTRVWTPGYASPEQSAGRAVTTATDVFSLGMLLRELLEARRPDGSASAAGLEAVPLDADLRAILAQATATEAGERYPTVDALRDELQRWREGRPVRAMRPRPLYRLSRFARRHRGSVSVAVLVLLALLLFLWRLGLERDRALAAEAHAEQQRALAEQSAEQAQTTLNFFSGLLLELSPDGDVDAPVTLRRMLERGADRVRRELPQGASEVALVNAYLGSLHALLGEPTQAEPLLRDSLQTLSAQGLDRGPAYARAASLYSQLLVDLGRLPEATPWLERAERAYLAQPGPDARAMAAVHRVQAATYAERFNEAEREARLGLTVALRERASADAVATLDQQLAGALNSQARSAEAAEAAAAGLARLREAGLGNSLFAYQFEFEAGRARLGLGEAQTALDHFDRARALYVQARGEGGLLRIIVDEWRMSALHALGRPSEARALAERVQLDWQGLGRAPDALSRWTLAHARLAEGDLVGARAEVEALLGDASGFAGLQPGQADRVRWGAARVLALSGAFAEARAAIAEGLKAAALAEAQSQTDPKAAARWSLLQVEVEQLEGRAAAAAQTLDALEAEAGGARALRESQGLQAARLQAQVRTAAESIAAAGEALDWAQQQTRTAAALEQARLAVDRVEWLRASGERAAAAELLSAHLPELRARLRIEQPDRARAEALAAALGLELAPR
jgi:serine/threonine-protein kinase